MLDEGDLEGAQDSKAHHVHFSYVYGFVDVFLQVQSVIGGGWSLCGTVPLVLVRVVVMHRRQTVYATTINSCRSHM
jgi:hypothetical protein